MATSCNDVCDVIIARLLELDFPIDDDESAHDDILAALEQCHLARKPPALSPGTPEQWVAMIEEVLSILAMIVEAKLLTGKEAGIVGLIYSRIPARVNSGVEAQEGSP